MDAYNEISPLWDLSQASSFSQLPDDDFLALLQKQFPNAGVPPTYITGASNSLDPRFSLSSATPPSDDSSPSPPQEHANHDEGGDSALKRKASTADDFEEGPSQKSQHTSNNSKRSPTTTSSRRKSTGTAPAKDETRLLKRKEQNRAAQRAFRERKEKHVKDLEDKVAALEAKNEQAVSENENLRDLLSRLQSENMMLKQAPFTFTVPKSAASAPEKSVVSPVTYSPDATPYASSSHPSTSISSPISERASPKSANPLDWSSLTSFDPSILNLLDDHTQQTATDDAMRMDWGFGDLSDSFTTIASNPMFLSYASAFDTPTPTVPSSDQGSLGYDLSSFTPSWSSPPSASQDTSTLDEIFGNYMGQPSYSYPTASPLSISPVTHHETPSSISKTEPIQSGSTSSSSSSPESSGSDAVLNTPGDSTTSDSDGCHDERKCPKTKADLARHIESSGTSPFAPHNITLKKVMDGPGMVMCQGSSIPKTDPNEHNVEVLSAWRSITTHPRFKNADINELCSEFTRKARCDGKKVVLEPQGVDHILESLSSSNSRQ